jgi:putative inorganic carbon (hco3(-)) transporter
MSTIQNLASDVVPSLALENMDTAWDRTLRGSSLYRLWISFLALCAGLRRPFAQRIGSLCQSGSFLLVLGLILALGLPQFANDKEGLALFVLGGVGLRVLGAFLGGKEHAKVSAIDAVVLAVLATNIIATASSHYLSESIRGLAKVIVYIASYFLFTNTLGQSRRRIAITVMTLLGMGLAVALYGLYQYKIGVAPLATWEDPTVETKGTRIFSTLGNPNLLAAFLIPMVPLSFSLALGGLFQGFSRIASAKTVLLKSMLLVIPAFIAGCIFSAATVLTGSRGGYIGLFAALAVVLLVLCMRIWRDYPKLRIVIVIGLLAVPIGIAAALHYVPAFEQRFSSIFAGREHSSNSYRLNVWAASWQMFLDNWWFGVGPGNKAFIRAYGLYMRSGFDALGTYCVPLEILVETGIIGLLAFGALLISVASRAHLIFWQAKDDLDRWLSVGCIAGVLGLMAQGLFDTVFYRPQVQFIFWLLVAIIVVLRTSRVQPEVETSATTSGA